MDLTFILLATSSILYVLLSASLVGAALIRGAHRHRIGGLLPLYVLLSFLWTVGQVALYLGRPGPQSGDLLARLLLYALLPLAMLFLALTCQFLTPHGHAAYSGAAPSPAEQAPPARSARSEPVTREGLSWHWWTLGLAWLVAVVVVYEGPPAMTGFSFDILIPPFIRHWLAFASLVAGWGFILAAAAVLTYRAYHRSRQPLHRNRILCWSLALALTFAGGVAFLSGNRGWGSMLQFAGSSSAAYLLMAHTLPDVRRLARDTLSYLILTLLMVTLCAALFLAGYYTLQAVPGYPPWLLALPLALVLATVVRPLLDWVRRRITGKAITVEQDASRVLSEYSTLTSNILDLEDLSIVALGLVREALNVRRGALLVVEDDDGKSVTTGGWASDGRATMPPGHVHLRVVTSTGRDLPPIQLAPESPLVQHMLQEQRPVTQYDLDLQRRFRRMSVREREWLSSLDMDIYVPICTEGGWIGLMTLGPRQTGQPYSRDDLCLLGRLASQTAATLQNAQQFELMKTHSAECERIIWRLSADKQALARLDKDKAVFLGLAARELRGQLQSIKGYVDLLCEMESTRSFTPEQDNQMIEGIRNSLQSLDGITQALRDASEMELEAPKLQMLPVSLEMVVEATVAPWEEALKEQSLTFSTQGLEDLPTIVADGHGLQAIFAELLQNACRFTPAGGQIQIRGLLRDGELAVQDQSVEIVVADTGRGIDREDLARVFDPFFRRREGMLSGIGQNQLKTAGPGLGLTRVRRIVQAHGGRIWAESPGYNEADCPGTEMHLILPLKGRV